MTQGRCGCPICFATWCAGKSDALKPINVRKLQAWDPETMVTGMFGASIGCQCRSSGRVGADGKSVAVLAVGWWLCPANQPALPPSRISVGDFETVRQCNYRNTLLAGAESCVDERVITGDFTCHYRKSDDRGSMQGDSSLSPAQRLLHAENSGPQA